MVKLFQTLGISLLCLFCLNSNLLAQQDSLLRDSRNLFEISGYVKDLQILSHAPTIKELYNDNLIHNRLKLQYFPTEELTFDIELRNRLFTGESLKLIENYGDALDDSPGIVDMSWLLINNQNVILLSQVDRLWMDFNNNKWELRLGRQRINWGMNLFWNPNDLFNVYSIVDFDYEERPGSDALRVQYHFENFSKIEFGLSPSRNGGQWISALMYKFNKWQYDMQVLFGVWNQELVFGTGWSGYINNLGFKGEASLFVPIDHGESVLSMSLTTDYLFSNQLFLSAGILLNSAGIDESISEDLNLFTTPLSAKSLMPAKYSGLISFSYPINPILSPSFVIIYSPIVDAGFLMPSIGMSISNNWELAFFGQSFWIKNENLTNLGNGFFLRLKGSF